MNHKHYNVSKTKKYKNTKCTFVHLATTNNCSAILWSELSCGIDKSVHAETGSIYYSVSLSLYLSFLLSFGFVVHAETRAISSLNWQPIYYSRCALSLLKRLITTPKVGTFKQGMFSHVFYVYTWFQITSQDCTCCRWSSISTTYFICFYLPFKCNAD